MHLFLGLPLALCALSLVSPAPVQEPWKDMQNPEFQDAADSGHSLVKKIVADIEPIQKSWIHPGTTTDRDELQYMTENILKFPKAPTLKPLSDKSMLCAHVSQIAEGLRFHHTLLRVVSKLAHAKSERVEELLHDIRDLLTQVHKMQNLICTASTSKAPTESEDQLQKDLASRIKDEYTSQVAAVVVLKELKTFSQHVKRSLWSMISVDSQSQTTLGWN